MRLNSPKINIITRTCMKASRSLIRDFGEIENLQVSSKGPGDFVTSADKRTEKIIIEELQKAHPDYGIITEESGIIKGEKETIVIDPIDGTKEYINSSPNFTVNFALIEYRVPVFGLISQPHSGIIWYSFRGKIFYYQFISFFYSIIRNF